MLTSQVIFTELIDRTPSPTATASQTLILVHRRELVEQAARHVSRRYLDKKVEIEMGSMRASGRADVTVASIQSISSRDRIDKFDPSRFKLVLVDEAHHVVAPNYLNVLGHFGFKGEESNAVPALVGVSATMARFDGLALGKVIKHIVYHKDYVDMIGAEWLAKVIFTTVKIKADLSNVRKSATGDFLTPSLSKAVNTRDANEAIVRSWRERASARKSTLIFCVDLEHVQELTNCFRRHKIDARFITGNTERRMRAERLEAFKQGQFPVLLNCAVFTEGTDIPNIDCVILARPTRSRNLIVQMIGRGMRLHPGKENCHVIDMVASLESGMITTPTLFGLDPDEAMQEASPADAAKLKERQEAKKAREAALADRAAASSSDAQASNVTVTFRDYDSVGELIDESSGERFIRAISRNAWVNVGPNRFILTNGPEGSYLDLEQEQDGLYSVKVVRKLPSDIGGKSPFTRPRAVVKAPTLESAVRGADTYASRAFQRNFVIARGPGAGWRDAPASDAQVTYINKFRNDDDQLDEDDDVTKGKAMDMITKVKFGARGRLNQIKVEKRKLDKMEKQRLDDGRRRERETVKTGPLDTDDKAVRARDLRTAMGGN